MNAEDYEKIFDQKGLEVSILPTKVQNILKELTEAYEEEVGMLKRNIETLLDEHYKDGRIKKLEEENQKLKEELIAGFAVTPKEAAKRDAWCNDECRRFHNLEFRFRSGGIGEQKTVFDTKTQEEFDYTDYTEW